MSAYNNGDLIVCTTEVRANGKKYILVREPSGNCKLDSDTFQIICKHPREEGVYSVLVTDDVFGFVIDDFKAREHRNMRTLKGQKYFDVSEEFIMGKAE